MSIESPLPPESPGDVPPPWAAGTDARLHELYPELPPALLDVLCQAGTEEYFNDGEWLWRVGDRNVPLYAVLEGGLDIVRHDLHGEHLVVTHTHGRFSGEIATMAGRSALISGRARGNLRAIAVSSEQLRELIAINPELGELLMQAFILRRMRMFAHHIGPITLVGSRFSAETAALRDFLTRNATPHEFIDLEEAEDVEDLFEQFNFKCEDTPVVLCAGKLMRNPTIEKLADCLGSGPSQVSEENLYDVAIIGAGPAGLATAVYAASEGLKVIVIERVAPGGQAGTSSRIENYPGFPTGISGQALAGRSWNQAQKFGAEFALPRHAGGVAMDGSDFRVIFSNGERLRARTVVLASGVIYRRPDIPGIDQFIGSGVHYTASYLESLVCRDQEIAILGGGNSAGQAAVYLSRYAQQVYILVRGKGLAESMSRYLIRRIETTPNVTLLTHTELSGVSGDGKLESVRWKNSRTGEETERPVQHVFVFIGASPCTDFLDESVARDAKGFIKTGTTLTESERVRYRALGEREPRFLETSWPNLYAIGDVRSGSLKRVAAAVGEGATVVSLLHEALHA